MSSVRQNKITTITNDEAYDLATHMARMADSANVIINVSSLAEADAIPTKYAGLAVRRLDIGPMAVDVWTGSAWFGARVPFGHMGKVDGFQTLGALAKVTFTAAQKLQGGVTFNNANDELVVPVAGQYRLTAQFYTTGNGSGAQIGALYVNTGQIGITTRHTKVAFEDAQSTCGGVYTLAANDAVSISAQGTAEVSTWGTGSHNGTWLEVEYLWPV
jgi:hypothetical protein